MPNLERLELLRPWTKEKTLDQGLVFTPFQLWKATSGSWLMMDRRGQQFTSKAEAVVDGDAKGDALEKQGDGCIVCSGARGPKYRGPFELFRGGWTLTRPKLA